MLDSPAAPSFPSPALGLEVRPLVFVSGLSRRLSVSCGFEPPQAVVLVVPPVVVLGTGEGVTETPKAEVEMIEAVGAIGSSFPGKMLGFPTSFCQLPTLFNLLCCCYSLLLSIHFRPRQRNVELN